MIRLPAGQSIEIERGTPGPVGPPPIDYPTLEPTVRIEWDQVWRVDVPELDEALREAVTTKKPATVVLDVRREAPSLEDLEPLRRKVNDRGSDLIVALSKHGG